MSEKLSDRETKEESNKTSKDNLNNEFLPSPASLPDVSPPVSKFRTSRWFVNQAIQKNQNDFPDKLEDETIERLSKKNLNIIPSPGIVLSVAERNMIDQVMRLLKENSEHQDENSENFYSGNTGIVDNQVWGNEYIRIPYLKIRPSVLFKACLSGRKVSGRDAKDLNELLFNLAKTNYLIRYSRKYFVTNGRKKETRVTLVETYSPLLEIIKPSDLSEEEFDRQEKELNNSPQNAETNFRKPNQDIVIRLNPVLVDQIQSFYVETPVDLRARLIKASGGTPRSITAAIQSLFDILNLSRANRHSTVEYNLGTLYNKLGLSQELKKNRRRAEASVKKAIQACSILGILLEAIPIVGADGQDKYVFRINLEFT